MRREEKTNNQTLSSFDVPIVILCGGKSSRMGEDKTFLPFGECDSLIEFQISRIESFFNKVFVSSKQDKYNFFKSKNIPVIADKSENIYSPLMALQSIFTQMKAPKVFILTVDTPFVSVKTIEKLIASSANHEITIASTPTKTHNLCGVFSASLLATIESMLDKNIHKIGYLIKQSHSQLVESNNEKEFLNMNTQADYVEALNCIATKKERSVKI